MTNKVVPEPVDFLIQYPLYESCEYAQEDLKKGLDLYQFEGAFDCFCPECNEHSIFSSFFSGTRYIHSSTDHWINKGKFTVQAKCSRNEDHKLFFLFEAKGNVIQKIGQLPSLASLHMYDAKKYNKVLEKQYFQEFTKAIGLVTHGVGVGSFVYLRRIFEALIEEAHQKMLSSEGWDESLYNQARMAEKISLLSSELPEFLIENKNMYGILSKGIHELSEKECLDAFPVVKLGIELILDARLEAMTRKKKLEEARKAIQSLASQM
ncbi:hypothetical protein NMT03_004704 [Vibrio alginolyticus]|nr:hypothetical protein [Vibrio alginolyticus]